MSKESSMANTCICGQRIQFMSNHWPHCKMNPDNLSREDRIFMEGKMSKADLERIAKFGAMA